MYAKRILFALACALVFASSVFAQITVDSTYIGSRIDYQVGHLPRSLDIADFDGDGILDLVVGNSLSNPYVFCTLKGLGDGVFAKAVFHEINGEYGECQVIAVDVNQDTKPDIVVINTYSSTISVLINDGGGTFNNFLSYFTGGLVRNGCTADMNSDGKIDVIMPLYEKDSVSILFNDGNGVFAPPQKYAVGKEPSSVTAADFNSDGKTDLAVINLNSYYPQGSASILLNNGNGTFASAVDYALGKAPFCVCAADFNGDGFMDLAVGNFNSLSISVLTGYGNGAFTSQVVYPFGTAPTNIISKDFNQDGRPDLALTSIGWGTGKDCMSILLNLGGVTFGDAINFLVGEYPFSLQAVDLNGDNKLDLITANSSMEVNGRSVSVLRTGNANPCFDSDYDGFGDPNHPENTCALDNCPLVPNANQSDWNNDGTGDACAPTDSGTNVTVQLTDSITITYDSVSQGGTSGVYKSVDGPYPYPNFMVLGSYFDISTTSTFQGKVIVCIHYADNSFIGEETAIRMYHFKGGGWRDVTVSQDTATNTICGEVTSFSYFALMSPCCLNERGNVDCDHQGLVDISDLTKLIDYLFISAVLCCQTGANIDGSPDDVVDISDVMKMVDYLLGTTTLETCPL